MKLHGSNCAVQHTGEGIVAQSRTALLTAGDDYKGFAAWTQANAGYFQALPIGAVVFGEWCGPGVEKGMAISQVPSKVFAVFAVQLNGHIHDEPQEIRSYLPSAGAPEALHVLPWDGEPVTIDFGSRAQLDTVAIALNERVASVEREDPWVKAVFGISGLGEGLVFYPAQVGDQPPDREALALGQLMFKAKGEKHRTAGTKTAVQVDATVVASVDEFVDLMVTQARLQQGVGVVGGRDAKLTGKFLGWVSADVQKESAAELEAAGLAWAQVEKAVQTRARQWFVSGAVPKS